MALIDKKIYTNSSDVISNYYFTANEVKKAVKELDKWLYDNRHREVDYFAMQDIRKKLFDIFGDFEK